MSLKDFKVLDKLGEGSYSSVYKVERLSDGQIYALKKVKMEKLTDKEKENSLNEVRILASIKHQNVVSYKEAFIDEASSTLCLVMEFAENGDLYAEIINYQKQGTLPEEDWVWRIIIQLVRGLKALHTLKILHRDLKSANVFLTDEKQTAKLGDMNVSKVAKKGLLYTQTGTPYYASPEVWRDNPYDHKSDIWSMGCVIYELVTLKPPFRAENMEALFKKVQAGKYPRISETYSQDLANFIRGCLQVQPHLRLDCDKILGLAVIHKKTVRFFPEAQDITQYENVLLKTIKLPRNLMYVTDKLPGSTYDTASNIDDDTLRFPEAGGGFKIKRNTTDAYMEKAFQRAKRHQSVERGNQDYLALHKSDQVYKHYKKRKATKRTGEDEEGDENNQGNINQESSQREIIGQIIQTKKEIDSEFNRMAAPEQIPRAIDGAIRKKKRKQAIMQKLEGLHNSVSEQQVGPQRIVMQNGIYDMNNGQEDYDKRELAIANQLRQQQEKHAIREPLRSSSVVSQQDENASLSRILKRKSPLDSENTSLERPQYNRGQLLQLPTIQSGVGTLSNQRNLNSNLGGVGMYQKSHTSTMDYQQSNPSMIMPPRPPQQQIMVQQDSNQYFMPTNSDRYMQQISRPNLGVNVDRFSLLSQRERLQSLNENARIKNLINQQRQLTNSHQQSHHNSPPVNQMMTPQQYQYNLYIQNTRRQVGDTGVPATVNSLGVGRPVDYYSRQF